MYGLYFYNITDSISTILWTLFLQYYGLYFYDIMDYISTISRTLFLQYSCHNIISTIFNIYGHYTYILIKLISNIKFNHLVYLSQWQNQILLPLPKVEASETI